MDKKLEPVVKIEGFSVDYLVENKDWRVIREELLQSTSVPGPVPGPGVQRSLNCGSTSTSDAAVITAFRQEIGSNSNSKQMAQSSGQETELQVTTSRGVKRGSREENPYIQERFKCSILNKKKKNEMNVASNSLSTVMNEVIQDHVVNNEAAEGIEIVHLTPATEADLADPSQVNRNPEEMDMVIFRCSVCPKKYTTQEALNWHVERNHENVQRSCKLCPLKGFKERQELVRHIKRCHREFCYCFKCNESFGTKAEFDKHLDSTIINEFTVGLKHDLDSKTNNNEFYTVQLKYKCQMCSATLNSQCEFSSHIKGHAAKELKT